MMKIKELVDRIIQDRNQAADGLESSIEYIFIGNKIVFNFNYNLERGVTMVKTLSEFVDFMSPPVNNETNIG